MTVSSPKRIVVLKNKHILIPVLSNLLSSRSAGEVVELDASNMDQLISAVRVLQPNVVIIGCSSQVSGLNLDKLVTLTGSIPALRTIFVDAQENQVNIFTNRSIAIQCLEDLLNEL